MGIRSFFKDFSNVIDETLRQKSGPSRTDQFQRALQESTSKASLSTLLSSGVAPKGGRELLTFEIGKDIFEIGEDIHLFLAPTNIQINSPDRIEEALFEPFRTIRKQILIINAQNGKVIPATIHTIDDTFLIADTEHSTVLLKSGEPLVVVFPVLPQRHYVLQTMVEAVYPHRLKLQYKDPRYDRRWSMPPTIPVRLRLASAEVMLAMTRRQGHMVREMTMASDEADGIWTGHIADYFQASKALEPSQAMQGFDVSPSCTGGLTDLSLGGAGLTLRDTCAPDELLRHVILLSIELPRVTLDTLSLQLLLTVLGVVRHVRATPPGLTLHIRFLHRLSKELDPLFEHVHHGGLKS
jgi:hypothetical protein